MRRALFAASAAVALAWAPLEAQVVTVHLRETESGLPIAGAVVRLLQGEAVVARALTNANGRAALQAPREGTYRARINRIGYQALTSEPLVLETARAIDLPLKMSTIAVALPALVTTTKSVCGGHFSETALSGIIWEQIQTALTASVITQRDQAVRLSVKEFRRHLTTNAGFVSETIVSDAVVRGRPYAAPPAAELVEKGFATFDKDEMTFSAPDAELFLSDDFVSTHCFRAVVGRTDSTVGLAFEPAPGRRKSDIRGTLWVTRPAGELQSIEFSYVNLPVQLRELGLGGRVEFTRLATGAWIVSYWHIRMPRMAAPPDDYRGKVRSVPHLAGFVEVGGRGQPAGAGGLLRATIRGTIYDSTLFAPVAGAVVRLAGSSDSVFSDSAGRYVFVSTLGGSRTLIVSHPKLGLIDDGSHRDVLLSLGETSTTNITVPPTRRFADDFCGPGGDGAGIVGQAFSGGAPREGLDLRVDWLNAPGTPGQERATTGPRGLYIFCDLPGGRPLTVSLLRGASVLVERTVTPSPGEYLWIDLKPPV